MPGATVLAARHTDSRANIPHERAQIAPARPNLAGMLKARKRAIALQFHISLSGRSRAGRKELTDAAETPDHTRQPPAAL